MKEFVAAVIAAIFSLFGLHQAPVHTASTPPSAQVASAVSAVEDPLHPASNRPSTTTSRNESSDSPTSPQAPIIKQYITQPVVERIIQSAPVTSGRVLGASTDDTAAKLADLQAQITALASLPRSVFVPSFSGPAATTPVSTATFAQSSRIDQLDGVTITGATITGSTVNGVSDFSGGSGTSQWTTSDLNIFFNTANVGIGTTSPGSLLSVGNTNGINFSTGTSTFSSIGGINLRAGCFAVNNICITGGTGSGAWPFTTGLSNFGVPVQATTTPLWFQNGLMASSTSYFVNASTTALTVSGTGFFGTATTTSFFGAGLFPCTSGNFLTWTGGLFGCAADQTGGSTWPFTPTTFGATAANSTSTLIGFTNGIYSLASSTIGNGTQTGGLTISGGATTTGNSLTGGNAIITGTLTVNSASASTFMGQLRLANGTAAVPAYSGTSVINTGMFFITPGGLGNIGFSTAALERMRIDSTGNVGFGTTSPWAKLSIAGAANAATPLFTISTSTTGATSTAFIIDQTGNVGIGTTSPTTALQVNGSITPNVTNAFTLGNAMYLWSAVYATNNVIQTSDARLKDNVASTTHGLDQIMQLRPVSYTWKAHPEQGTKLGFIAQEVQPILPETVSVGDDVNHTMGLTYTELIPVIVRAIQQLAAKISDLADTVAGFAEKFTTKELVATNLYGQKLCLGQTCITETQLAALLSQSAAAGLANPSPTPTDPASTQPPLADTATSTDLTSSPQAAATSSLPTSEPSDTATSSPAVTESALPVTETTTPIANSPPLAPDEEPEPTPTQTTAPASQ